MTDAREWIDAAAEALSHPAATGALTAVLGVLDAWDAPADHAITTALEDA